jgi:prepilin-type N-terminal cleavage/methylation domain-containing protein
MAARKKKGFTLIELLVVIGILAVLVSIVLIAINPAEQLNRANDVSAKATASEFIKASMQEYTVSKSLPWDSDTACQTEMQSGETLADIPACIHALINDEKLESNFKESSNLNELHVTKCGKSAVICYSPKSKVEYEQAEAKYNKFGVSQPGCPGNGGSSEQCYWCRPIHNDPECLPDPTPTPTVLPTDAPTVTPTLMPTATTAPANTPTPTPSYMVGGYRLDDTKLFQTYAVFFFDQPSFVSSWYFVSVSTDPTFPNDYTKTDKYFAPASTPSMGTLTSPSHKAYVTFTNKLIAFQSLPYQWPFYKCGVTLYWKVRDFPTYTQDTEVHTNIIDCSIKVGAFSATGEAPLNWYIYYPYIDANGNVNPGQPYNSTMDANNDGKVDWFDYMIIAMNTKMRAGGWAPPE